MVKKESNITVPTYESALSYGTEKRKKKKEKKKMVAGMK